MEKEVQYELALQQELTAATRERHALLVKTVKELAVIKNDAQLVAAIEILTQLTDYNGTVIRQITEWSKPYKAVLEELAAYKRTFAVESEIGKVKALISDFEAERARAQVKEAERLSALAREKEKAMMAEQDELAAMKLHREANRAREAAFEAITPTKGLSVGFRWTGELVDWLKVHHSNPQLLYPPTLNKLALQDLLKQLKAAGYEIKPDTVPGIKLTEATQIRLR